MNTWYNVLGSHIPARFPLPVPGYYPLDDVPVYVTLPQSWLPHILGVCQTFARPETWNAGDTDAQLWANSANDLFHMLASANTTPPGCEVPGGSWFCGYNFVTGDGGFVVYNDGSQDWGEYVYGEGWRASVVDTGGGGETRYRRVLKLTKQLSVPTNAYWVVLHGSLQGEFAGGSAAAVLHNVQLQGALGSVVQSMYAYLNCDWLNMQWSFQSDGLLPVVQYWAEHNVGWASSPGQLDFTSFLLTGIDMYGYGTEPTC